MQANRNTAHYSSHRTLETGGTVSRSLLYTPSVSSFSSCVETSPRDSPKTSILNPQRAGFAAYKDAKSSQVMIDNYRQLKKKNMHTVVKQYMSGGQENLFLMDQHKEMNIIEDSQPNTN